MDRRTHPVFIPNNFEGDRHRTAVLLVGTAREFNVPQREIASTMGGFYITSRLADILDEEAADSDEVDSGQIGETAEEIAADLVTDTNTSGNRAAKTNTSKKGK